MIFNQNQYILTIYLETAIAVAGHAKDPIVNDGVQNCCCSLRKSVGAFPNTLTM
ncbi:MAG: hypothetical protein AB4063_25695 [Crocosphaera sp.]